MTARVAARSVRGSGVPTCRASDPRINRPAQIVAIAALGPNFDAAGPNEFTKATARAAAGAMLGRAE